MNAEGQRVHTTADEAIIRTNARRSLKLDPSFHPFHTSQSPMTTVFVLHVSSELERYLVVWKEFQKRLYRVLGALSDPFDKFRLLGLGYGITPHGHHQEHSSPASTAHSRDRLHFTRPSSHWPHSLLLGHVLVDGGPDTSLPSISRERAAKTTPSRSGHAHVSDEWPIFHTVYALRRRCGVGRSERF